jgi:hypothetical protein
MEFNEWPNCLVLGAVPFALQLPNTRLKGLSDFINQIIIHMNETHFSALSTEKVYNAVVFCMH